MVLLASLTLVVGVSVAGCSSDDGSDGANDGTTSSQLAGESNEESDAGEGGSTTVFERTEPLPTLTEREQEFADVVRQSMEQGEAAIVAGADYECLSAHWIHIIGEDALTTSGVTPEEFASQGPPVVGIDRSTAEEMVDAMGSCGAGVDRFYEEWAVAFGADPSSDGGVVNCMKEQVPVDDFRGAMVDTFVGEDASGMKDLQARFEPCVAAAG